MFEQLDYLYTPSRDVAADAEWLTRVAGGNLVFAIEAMGTRVAMVELTAAPPRIVLAGHLDGDRPVHVYRVPDLDAAVDELRSQGLGEGHALEIPMGPVRSYTSPNGHRIAIYELTRPDVLSSFIGRRDF